MVWPKIFGNNVNNVCNQTHNNYNLDSEHQYYLTSYNQWLFKVSRFRSGNTL